MNKFDLNNRTAVITGGAQGFGLDIAKRFLDSGAKVIIWDIDEIELIKASKKLNNSNLVYNVVDVSNFIHVKETVLEIVKFSKIDILINNAGVFLPGEMMKEVDGNLEMMIETNLYSAYHLTRAIVPMMQAVKDGHIFNMCSIASFMSYPNGGSYSISKFAMLGMSKVLREEMKPYGIRVTAVMPGATWSNSWAGFEGPEDRLMKPEDIADTILSVSKLSKQSVVEEIIIRPQLGDL